MWLQRESNARPRAKITNFGILVEGHGTCPGVLVSAICQLLAMRPTIQRIKACNSCLSPKDVICNVAAGGSGCNLEWLSGMCGICSHCSEHFVAFYVVGLGRRVVCAIFFATPMPPANGVACFKAAL